MRLQGKIESWNDDRGFGFVVQNSTGEKAFVHISALSDRRRRPVVGALITYRVVSDKRGPKAVDVRYVDRGADRSVNRGAERERAGRVATRAAVLGAFALAVIGYQAYVRHSPPAGTSESSIPRFVSAQEELPEKHQEARREEPRFQCEPKKTYCSQMSSCEEALFHQQKCGGTKMDGDNDGIPCERQWCQD